MSPGDKSKELLESIDIIVEEEDLDSYRRLDVFLSEKVKDLSRNVLKNLFVADKIYSKQGSKLSLKKMPPPGTELVIEIPPPIPDSAVPENIPLEFLYQDEHIAVINKPAGIVTHPAPGNYTGTLVNAILFHCKDLSGVGSKIRPGIVHRLDKGTSGIMVIAKGHKAHENLVTTFAQHNIQRVYQAILMGTKIPSGGTLKSTIGRHPNNRIKMAINVKGGKDSVTHYKLLGTSEKFSLCKFTLETGRTHQIRVHAASLLNAPIFNDPTYGNPKENRERVGTEISKLIGDYPYPFLHARVLGFKHPITNKELYFEIDPPEPFLSLTQRYFKDANFN